MTAAGHNSLVAIAEWAHRCDQAVLARLGCFAAGVCRQRIVGYAAGTPEVWRPSCNEAAAASAPIATMR